MTKKNYIIVGILITGLLLLIHVLWKNPLERFLDRAIEAVQEENTTSFLKLISDNYIDRYGLTKDNINEILRRFFERFDDIKVITSNMETTINQKINGTIDLSFKVVATSDTGSKSKSEVDLSVYGKQRFYIVGGPTQNGTMKLRLRKEGKFWRLLTVDDINVGYTIPHYSTPKGNIPVEQYNDM